MATPLDLEDFAVGFSLSEGIINSPADIEHLEIVEQQVGVELRMRLAEPHAGTFSARRRYLAGPTAGNRQRLTISGGGSFSPQEIMQALRSLEGLQSLHHATRAVHGAAFWRPGEGILALREDVGRHNALDKLVGTLARNGQQAATGFGIVTSRLSIEMIQKAAAIGIPLLVAISAPTALAVRAAEMAGMTLVAVARNDGFEVFTHPDRIKENVSLHVVTG